MVGEQTILEFDPTPEKLAFIQGQVEAGLYASVEAAVLDAVVYYTHISGQIVPEQFFADSVLIRHRFGPGHLRTLRAIN